MVVQVLRAYTGRGPTKAWTSIDTDLIVVVLHATLTKGERSLVADGRAQPVRDMRKAYQDTMGPELTAGVEGITGREVHAFLSDNHIDPDIARMTVGVESAGSNVGQVVADVNAKQSAIIAKLKSLGVSDKDIQTTSFNVSLDNSKPQAPGSPNTGPITYRVNNTAQITIRKIDQLSAILQAAVDAGANNIYGISMSLSDPSPLASDARTKAVADARTKAEALAKAAGVKLGRIVSISEFTGSAFPPAVFADSRANAQGPIETGELQVQVQVNVVFAIEQ